MKTSGWRRFSLQAAYLVAKTSLGLLLHPYQTTQAVFRQKKFYFLILTPAIYYFLAMSVWRIFLRDLVRFFIDANCFLMLMKTSLVFFALFWQLSLAYLLLKFLFLTKKGSDDK